MRRDGVEEAEEAGSCEESFVSVAIPAKSPKPNSAPAVNCSAGYSALHPPVLTTVSLPTQTSQTCTFTMSSIVSCHVHHGRASLSHLSIEGELSFDRQHY